jgi:hypothetical protein
MTHIRLANAGEDMLAGALDGAWRLQVEKNRQAVSKKRGKGVREPATKRGVKGS